MSAETTYCHLRHSKQGRTL